jgi:hypothetical protein
MCGAFASDPSLLFEVNTCNFLVTEKYVHDVLPLRRANRHRLGYAGARRAADDPGSGAAEREGE